MGRSWASMVAFEAFLDDGGIVEVDDDMPDAYRQAVFAFIEMHANSELMGGLRGVRHHLQTTAVQGSPDVLTAVTGQWMPGATRHVDRGHPFKLHFDDLEVGTAVRTGSHTVTLADIEGFAESTGDHFYAHMDEEAAAASPIFGGRVAHGYLVLSLAAGLFVWPDPGPVLANYGVDHCRFAKPTYPGDTLTVWLTAKRKTLRAGAGYGEVVWDAQVSNQDDEVVAAYDVLTMVAKIGRAHV